MAGKRNRDETIGKLLAAVGEILQEKGHAGLGINKIALRAGVNKKLIYYYFGGLNELVKAYIHGKDYWLPLFDAFQWPGTFSKKEIEELFTGLLVDQFNFFSAETEMQKFILWQISEPNALMRAISEEREKAGAKFLELTDPFFKDTGMDFRSVVALLVGGIYYVVLHARHNKSSVCGIDINRQEDCDRLLETIRQLLGSAWGNAVERKVRVPGKLGNIGMKYELEEMEGLVMAYLDNKDWDGEKERSLQQALDKFPKALMEGALSLEPVKLPLYIRWHQEGLVELSNLLYEQGGNSALGEQVQVWLGKVEALLDFLNRSFREETDSFVEIPLHLWRVSKVEVTGRRDLIRSGLKEFGISELLIEIALIPLTNWLDERAVIVPKYSQHRYLLFYMAELQVFLEHRHKDGQRALLCKFIEMNFNHLRSFNAWINLVEEEFKKHPENPLTVLKRFRRSVSQVVPIPSVAYNDQLVSLRQQLEAWLEEEISLITEGVVGLLKTNDNLLKINLPVSAIAYLNKLLYRHRFFGEENQSVIIRHFVDHYSSVDTEQISLNSYSSKYRAKSPSDTTARTVRKLLKQMLEEVDQVLS